MSGVVTLANDDLVIEVESQRGGRVVRLFSRLDGREWLRTGCGRPAPAPTLDAVFTDTDHFGWDEMLPTVDPCRYVGDPYDQVDLADHGELWSTTWEVVAETGTSLHQRARGQRLDYTFDRNLDLEGATLRVNYTCSVGKPTTMLWAMHPQFAMRRGTRLVLTNCGTRVLNTSTGEPETEPWPGDLVVERDVLAGDDRMLYVDPTDTVTTASLVDVDGASLTMDWDHDFARYLGIWIDHGRYTDGRVVAIEPTNGFFDELARAQRSHLVTEFLPQRPTSWWVEIKVTKGESS